MKKSGNKRRAGSGRAAVSDYGRQLIKMLADIGRFAGAERDDSGDLHEKYVLLKRAYDSGEGVPLPLVVDYMLSLRLVVKDLRFTTDHEGEPVKPEGDYTAARELAEAQIRELDLRGKVEGIARLMGSTDDLVQTREGEEYRLRYLAGDIDTLAVAAGWHGLHEEAMNRKLEGLEENAERDRARIAELESKLKVYEAAGGAVRVYDANDELGQLANAELVGRVEMRRLREEDIDAVVERHMRDVGFVGNGVIDDETYTSVKYGESDNHKKR